MRIENRLNKLESRVRVTEQHLDREIEKLLRDMSPEEILRLHAEHVENKPLTPEQVQYRERLQTMTIDEMMQEHYARC